MPDGGAGPRVIIIVIKPVIVAIRSVAIIVTGIPAMTVMAAVARKMAIAVIAVVTVMTSVTAVVLGLCRDGRQG